LHAGATGIIRAFFTPYFIPYSSAYSTFDAYPN
jgi:hypothetical protein